MASHTNSDVTTSDVTIIGLGRMGTALARALLSTGHCVTVWNRTTAKAEDLRSHGALVAESVDEALAASPATITCLTDDRALQDLFAAGGDAFGGRILVNLTSGDSAQARELARRARHLGADYLDGAIMAVPSAIGTTDAAVLLSGSPTAFDGARPVLDALGTTTYLGADPGLSALYDAADSA